MNKQCQNCKYYKVLEYLYGKGLEKAVENIIYLKQHDD